MKTQTEKGVGKRGNYGHETNGNNIITSPGKYEGEYYFVPDLWINEGLDEEIHLNDGTVVGLIKFDTDEDLVKRFPELSQWYGIQLCESDNGFVHTHYFDTEEEYEKQLESLLETAAWS